MTSKLSTNCREFFDMKTVILLASQSRFITLLVFIIPIIMNPTAHPLMSLATGLVALVREEKYQEAYETYFADHASSVEAFGYDGSDPTTTGKDNLITKAAKRSAMKKTVGLEVSDPSVINDNQFIVWMKIITKDDQGNTSEDEEYVLYTCEESKVVEERFFYIMPGYDQGEVGELSQELYARMQKGEATKIYEDLFCDHAKSIEAFTFDGSDPVTTGKPAMIEKGRARDQANETKDGRVDKLSLMNGNQCIISMGITAANRETGDVMNMSEYVLYTMKDGRIIEEKFFYTAM